MKVQGHISIPHKFYFLLFLVLLAFAIGAEASVKVKRDSLIARVNHEFNQTPIDTLIGQYRINDLMVYEVTNGSYEKADSVFELYKDFSVSDSILLFLYEMALGNYIDNGKTDKTIELATEILNRFPENHMAKSKAYIALSQTTYVKGQLEQTVPYIKLAILEAEQTGNQLTIDGSRMNLGMVFLQMGQVDSARIILKKLLLKKDNSFQTKWRNRCLAATNIGEMYLEIDLDSAEFYYKIAVEAAKQGDKHKDSFVAEGAFGLANVYIKRKDYDKAYEYLELAERNYTVGGKSIELANVYSLLSVLEGRRGRVEKAFEYLTLSRLYTDSLTKLASDKSLMEAQAKFDVVSKELQNEVLKKEKKQADTELALQRNLMIFIGLLFFLALLFILQLVSRKKAIQQLNSDLRRKKNHLAELINEKDNLMQVLIHDVRSPLASINGASSLLFNKKDQLDNQGLQLVNEMQKISNQGLEMINSIWNAYKVENNLNPLILSEIKLDKFITESVNEFNGKAKSRNINILVNASPLTIESNPDYLNIILRNLISNALKFSNLNTEITIACTKRTNAIEIRVKDQGPGFSEKDRDNMFQKFKKLSAKPLHNESSSGLGLYLVFIACSKLGIDIHLNPEYHSGAEFILKIPNAQN